MMENKKLREEEKNRKGCTMKKKGQVCTSRWSGLRTRNKPNAWKCHYLSMGYPAVCLRTLVDVNDRQSNGFLEDN